MVKINTIILSSNFELIRDRIGLILTEELANQYTLTTFEIYNATVWIERLTPFNIDEYPAITVRFVNNNDGVSSSKSDQSFNNTYYIDAYANDVIELQKLLGVIRAILMDTQYLRLDFAPPSISSKTVRSIQITDLQDNQDTETISMGRVTLEVKCNENVTLTTPIDLLSSYTTVKIGNTQKGFYYIKE